MKTKWIVIVDGQQSRYLPTGSTEREARRQLLAMMQAAGAPYRKLPKRVKLYPEGSCISLVGGAAVTRRYDTEAR